MLVSCLNRVSQLSCNITSQWGFTRPFSIYFSLGKVRDIVPLVILVVTWLCRLSLSVADGARIIGDFDSLPFVQSKLVAFFVNVSLNGNVFLIQEYSWHLLGVGTSKRSHPVKIHIPTKISMEYRKKKIISETETPGLAYYQAITYHWKTDVWSPWLRETKNFLSLV